MTNTYWHKQLSTKPLFPDLLWSKPESKLHAGKLLIIGGNQHAFSSPAECFNYANQAGIGSIRVILPQAVKKMAGKFLPEIEYAPSNPSGSFSKQALGEILEATDWADGVLLAGDFGHNSETTILIESFLEKLSLPVVAVGDAVDLILQCDLRPLVSKNICLILNISQLQRLSKLLRFDKAFTTNMNISLMVEHLRELYKDFPVSLILITESYIHIVSDLLVISTNISGPIHYSKIASYAAVWLLQNPQARAKAFTTAIYDSLH